MKSTRKVPASSLQLHGLAKTPTGIAGLDEITDGGLPAGRPTLACGAEKQVYRLYVSSASPISSRAVVNARRFLNQALPGAHRLEVLNIADHVAAAREDQIVVSPTLLRIFPLPPRRVTGDLSNVSKFSTVLGLPSRGA